MVNSQPIIIAISVVLAVIALVAVLFVIVKKSNRGLSGNKKVPPTGQPDQLAYGRWSGQVEGIDYVYLYSRGSKNSPPSLKISVGCQSPGSFKIKKETAFDRFFKKTGLCCEIQTQDEPFDEKFYISSDTVEFTRLFFSKAKNRQIITQLHEMGFNEISHNGKEMMVSCFPFRPGSDFSVSRIAQAAALLHQLTQGLPSAPGPDDFSAANWKSKRVLAFAVPILVEITAIIALAAGLLTYPPLDGLRLALDSLLYSVPFFIIFAWVAFQLLKGRSSSHREFMIVVLLSFVGFLMAGPGYRIFLNGALDTSEPAIHETLVVEKYITRSNKGRDIDYHIRVESWRSGEKTESLKISKPEFDRVETNRTEITVTTRAGKFAYEWLVGYQLHFPGKE